MTSLLATSQLTSFYGDFQALFGVDLAVEEGEAIAVIGANGAGQIDAAAHELRPAAAASDRIMFDGDNHRLAAPGRHRGAGIALVPEGRRLFPSLSVEENLLMGQQWRRAGPWTLDRVYALFPILRERRRRPSTNFRAGSSRWRQSAAR